MALVATLGCGGPAAVQPPAAVPGERPHAVLAELEVDHPAYGKPELREALIAERRIAAAAELHLEELQSRQPDAAVDDAVADAAADLAVRRRFIATLEVCDAEAQWCPPRLDDPTWTYAPDPGQPADPPMTATLRFDLASWRVLATELHGRACACRTRGCIDSVDAAIEQLERRPVPQVQSDEAATASITRARECLFRLLGKSLIPVLRRSQAREPT